MQPVIVLFGGRSGEHPISIISARAVITHLDRSRFQPHLLYLDTRGNWGWVDEQQLLEDRLPPSMPNSILPWLTVLQGAPTASSPIYFPVMHGPNGEDGKIQHLLELAGVPFVGADGISSALAMDKGIAKRLFVQAHLPTPEFRVFNRHEPHASILDQIQSSFTWPVFIKPCRMGSSVGISRCQNLQDTPAALAEAFRHDSRIIVEQGLRVREIEVAVMGNRELEISPPGELVPHNAFYDYRDKYVDGLTRFHIPALLNEEETQKARSLAEKAFRCLQLTGMARVDLFLDGQGQFWINEINTIPGFTEISMFPKLFALSGYTFTELVSRLLDLAREAQGDRQ